MINFIVHDLEGKILRTGCCDAKTVKYQAQASKGEIAIIGDASDAKHKIQHGKVVNLTLEEIEQNKPHIPEIPECDKQANITKGELAEILNRLADLESK